MLIPRRGERLRSYSNRLVATAQFGNFAIWCSRNSVHLGKRRMSSAVDVGGRLVGAGHPVYVVAEIGLNHNGDVALAKQLIDAAKVAGCDAVKFQKRTPDLATPVEQRGQLRQTPWGDMTYLEYRY